MNYSKPHTILKDIYLAGGGHTHALLIKKYGMNPWPGVRLNLISDSYQTPYSGMIPGLVAGHYCADDVFIDLAKLCEWSQVRFFQAKIEGIDLAQKFIILEDHPSLRWDLLSINTGSSPSLPSAPGFADYSVPIKPIAAFLNKLDLFLEKVRTDAIGQASIFIIGGGVAGIEIAFSLRARFRKLTPNKPIKIQLAHSGQSILPELSASARTLLEKQLVDAGISVLSNATAERLSHDAISIKGHEPFPCHFCVVCSQARAPDWPRAAGFEVSPEGFILVNSCLQSVSNSRVFAAGDIAQWAHPIPKAGVYAVRQAEPLSQNLFRILAQQPLVSYTPQKNFLKLIGTGNGKALAIKGGLHFYGKFAWKLKKAIDQKFMLKLKPTPSWLEKMPKGKAQKEDELLKSLGQADTLEQAYMRCSGCAAKWSDEALSTIMSGVRNHPSLSKCLKESDEPSHFISPDDAAIISVKPGFDLVQSIDFMPCLSNNPYLFGRILVNHCFNDIYAMGGSPHSAQALVMLPYAAESIASSDGQLLMQGIAKQLLTLDPELKLIGGHTCEGNPLSAGLVCNGLVRPKSVLRKGGLQPGDQLILTKPLGTGVLFAAAMRLASRPEWIEQAINSMLLNHSPIMEIVSNFTCHGATDISGFGLAGHLLEMQFAAKRNVSLWLDQIPTLPGTQECLKSGFQSSLHPKNTAKKRFISCEKPFEDWEEKILFDPQTAGPLLIAIPRASSQKFINSLHEFGFSMACVIGEVCAQWSASKPMKLSSK